MISSLLEIVTSRFLRRLRGVLSVELSGLIVLITGLSIAQTGMNEVVDGMMAGDGAARWHRFSSPS